MIELDLIRVEETSEGALGLLKYNGRVLCLTLEPDSRDPRRFQIPPGSYECRRFHGRKFKDTFEILVEGHTALLFHWGNTEQDTTGCVLLGLMLGEHPRQVSHSKMAFDRFMVLVRRVENFQLNIRSMA